MMIPIEISGGDDSFASLFPIIGEAERERKEKEQLEGVLEMLQRIDSERRGPAPRSRPPPPPPPGYYDYGGYYSDPDDDYRPYDSRDREYMRVSITDNERARREHELEARRKKEAHQRFHGKVHTLDDLPPDNDFLVALGLAPDPSAQEEIEGVRINADRRLKDGKVVYSAAFPSFSELLAIPRIALPVEWIAVGLLALLVLGVILGRVASRARAAKQMEALRAEHQRELEALRKERDTYATLTRAGVFM